jgi:hypothetical protein
MGVFPWPLSRLDRISHVPAAALLGVTQITAKWHLWLTLGLMLGIAAGTTGMALSATVANRWFTQRRGLVMGILTAAFATGQLTFCRWPPGLRPIMAGEPR